MDKQNNINNSDKKSFLDILILLFSKKKSILKIFIYSACLTIIIYFISPSKYVSSSKIFPDVGDVEEINMNQISKIGKIVGLDIGNSGRGTAILTLAYTDILKSREVLYKLIHDKIRPDSNSDSTYIMEYLNKKTILSFIREYTIGLIGKLIRLISKTRKANENTANEVLYLSKSEYSAMDKLRDNIHVEKDIESGILILSVTCDEPEMAALITNRLLQHLEHRVREIYTKKNKENLLFIDHIYDEAKRELDVAETVLANFLIENNNPQTPTLQIQLERLKRNLDTNTGLSTEIQTKLTNIKIALKRSEPVIIVIEKPNVPIQKSSFGIITIFILIILTTIMLYIIYFYLKYYISNVYQDPSDRAKVMILFNLIKDNKLIRIFRRR